MNALDKTKEQCSHLIRKSLPDIRKVAADMPAIPSFYTKPDKIKKGRHKFVETEQPNWWQLPKGLRASLHITPEGQELVEMFEKTPPFSKVFNKCIMIPDLGISSSYETGTDISNTFLTSYLFSAGCEK